MIWPRLQRKPDLKKGWEGCLYSLHVHSFTQKSIYSLPIIGRPPRPHCIPNPTFFPMLHAVFCKDPRHSRGNFIQTRMRTPGPRRTACLPFIHPNSVLDSPALRITWDTRKFWIQLESVEFSLFELT